MDANILVDTSKHQERLQICKSCDNYKPNTSVLPSRCGICGCVLYIKAKLESQHCPLDPPKW